MEHCIFWPCNECILHLSLYSLHLQDVLWHRKPYLKVSEREGRSAVQERRVCMYVCVCWGVSVLVSQKADSQTQHVTSDAFPSLSLSLFALHPTCLHVSVSAGWGARVQHTVNSLTPALTAKTSHSVTLPVLATNSITSPRFLFRVKKNPHSHIAHCLHC